MFTSTTTATILDVWSCQTPVSGLLCSNPPFTFPDSIFSFLGARKNCAQSIGLTRDRPSKRPIRARYLGHVTGYQPIKDQHFFIRSLKLMKLVGGKGGPLTPFAAAGYHHKLSFSPLISPFLIFRA
eukprot:sb/3475572/